MDQKKGKMLANRRQLAVVVMDNLFVGCESNLKDVLASGRVMLYKDEASSRVA